LFKDYSFIIICCSAANYEILLLLCCFLSVYSYFSNFLSSVCFSNSLFSKKKIVYLLFPLFFFFSLLSFLFFLKPITFRVFGLRYSAVDKVSVDVEFSKVENSRLLHLISELMVKRQPWFCWVLLVRDRVSNTLE